MGRNSHERICSQNPKNMKPHAKAKKNKKASDELSSHSRSKVIGKNNEGDLSKQYHPGAEYLSSLHAHESIRSLSGKLSSTSKNSYSDEDYFGDTYCDFDDKIQEATYESDEESESQPSLVWRENFDEVSSSDDEPYSWEAEDEYSTSDEESDPEDDMKFFKLPIKFQQVTTMYDAMKHKKPSRRKIHKAPQRYKYKNKLNAPQVALVDLANILSTRHKVDKKLFDCIASWARFHSNKDPNIWKTNGKSNVWTRKKLLKRLSDTFNTEGLRPTSKETVTHDQRKITVPVFNFSAQVRSILDDPEVMNKDNIMKGLDENTWRPKRSAEDFENDYHAVIADKDSGYLYRMGIEAHVPDHGHTKTKILPLPIIVHIDKSHYDLHSNLCVTPIGFTLAMLDVDTQQKVDSWRMMATIPNLSAKKGSNKKKVDRATQLNLQDMHNVLRIAFSSLEESWKEGGIVWHAPDGEVKILKPYIYMVIGDTVGNNELVAHYLGNTQGRCLVKDCKCCKEDLVKVPPKCCQMTYKDFVACNGDDAEIFLALTKKNLISLKDLSDIKDNQDLEKELSYYDVDNAFDHLPLADKYQGIVGITPQESLHVMEAGMYEHIPTTTRDIIGTNMKNQAVKEQVDLLFTDVKNNINRNSERDILRMSNRNGFFNLSKVNQKNLKKSS